MCGHLHWNTLYLVYELSATVHYSRYDHPHLLYAALLGCKYDVASVLRLKHTLKSVHLDLRMMCADENGTVQSKSLTPGQHTTNTVQPEIEFVGDTTKITKTK